MSLQEILSASAIALDVAYRAGVREVPGGIVWPYRSPSGQIVEVFRPDVPASGGPKYLWPARTPLCLTVHPDMDARLADPSKPLLIIEGTKQYLCVVTWLSQDYAAVGMNGCWGWSQDQKPGPDLDRLQLPGREIILFFDRDWQTNPNVWDAASGLTQALVQRGARQVRYARF